MFGQTTNDVPRDAYTDEQETADIYEQATIELSDVSRVVLHQAATLLWIKSLFEQIHFISLTAACVVKTGFKVKGMLYGMQPQPGQPFLINHSIGVLA